VRQLRSLRLLKFFVQSGCVGHEDLYDSVYNDDESDDFGELRLDKWCRLAADEAKVAADHIFASLAEPCPEFVALSIDINEHFGAELECSAFLRSRQTDVFGRTTWVAQSIDARTLKYYVPCSDVLRDIEDEDLSPC